MAFNGTGTFVRLFNWVADTVAGIFVRNDRMDAEMDGFATGLSNCITKDGQTTVIANIPLAGFKFTGLGTGTGPADSVTYAQVFSSPSFTTPYAVSTPALGSNNLLLATTAYVDTTAINAALPGQSSATKGQVPVSNGTTAAWGNTLASTYKYSAERSIRRARYLVS